MLSNCLVDADSSEDNKDAVCSMKDQFDIDGDEIEIIVINIGTDLSYGIKEESFSCLNDDFNELFVYQDFAELEERESILYAVRYEICTMPTKSPTISPTMRPTHRPSKNPTAAPSKSPTDIPSMFLLRIFITNCF